MAAPTRPQGEHRSPDEGFQVLVMGPDVFATRSFPNGAEVLVGRDEECDLRVADELVSRRHACLRIGSPCTIEDLRSPNGTFVREARIAAGAPVEIIPGEAIVIGSTVLMLQAHTIPARPRRIYPHGYFEARLEEECEKAEGLDAAFAVVRVRLPSGAADAAAQAIARVLRPGDVLGAYSRSDYEILLVETSAAHVRILCDEMTRSLRDIDARHKLGVATYPRDGRTADELVAVACAAIASERAGAPSVVPPNVIVASPSMHAVYDLARKAARGTINVLITGETGSGKEMLARHVHDTSPRAGKPRVSINCAALSETLLESELFGHERGAFTGAMQTKPGLLETATGGTVFLDEIGEMSLPLQAKILRVIENKQLIRVGGLKPLPIDVRFVSATNRDLAVDVAAGEFRQDLFFRLNGIRLDVPPLRERPEEIPLFAREFVEGEARRQGIAVPPLSRAALAALESYEWPGNVRELRNTMERAVLLSEGSPIGVEHLQIENRCVVEVRAAGGNERDRIQAALDRCGGNQSRAAHLLGMSRRTFCRRFKDLGFIGPRGPAPA